MACPLCRHRKARRACPAIGDRICTVCCGTKRLVEIRCPADCPYLASAREHPAAAVMRRQQRDLESLIQLVRDFSDRQSQLFFMIATLLTRYEPPELHALLDVDIAEAARALASTFETSSRGVIYEHRPASLPAERLASALKPVLLEAGQRGGSSYERDAAVVLRRLVEAADARHGESGRSPDSLIDLLRRMIRRAEEREEPDLSAADAPRLIVP